MPEKKVRLQLTGEGISLEQELDYARVRQLLLETRGKVVDSGSFRKVDGYRAIWNLGTHDGQVQLRIIDPSPSAWGFLHDVTPASPEEMNVLLRLLGSGLPVEFDTAGKVLRAGDQLLLP